MLRPSLFRLLSTAVVLLASLPASDARAVLPVLCSDIPAVYETAQAGDDHFAGRCTPALVDRYSRLFDISATSWFPWGRNTPCDATKPFGRLMNALWVLENSSPTGVAPPGEESGDILRWAFNYTARTIANLKPACSTATNAHTIWGLGPLNETELRLPFFTKSVVERASIVLHEARHADGYGHHFADELCRAGGSCDFEWDDFGANSVEVLWLAHYAYYGVSAPEPMRAKAIERANSHLEKRFVVPPAFRIADDFNDVVEPVRVFDGYRQTGASQALWPGRYDLPQLALGAGRLASMRIPPGWTVTLFDRAGFQGRSRTFVGPGAGATYRPAVDLEADFVNVTSSLIVDGPVVLFQHAGFGGRAQALWPGRYPSSASLIVGNDSVSSLVVPPGWTVRLYPHRDFDGPPTTYTAGQHASVGGANDSTTSVIVEAPPTLYDGDLAGKAQTFRPGAYTSAQLTIGANTASTVTVPFGWRVTLYSGGDFTGRELVLYEGTHRLSDAHLAFDNLAGSLVVRGVPVAFDWWPGGASQPFGTGAHDWQHLGALGDDRASHLVVPFGYLVTLWEYNFWGRAKTFGPGVHFLGPDFDNLTSAVVVNGP